METRANEPLGELLEDGTVVFERLLPGSLERVWDYLIDGELRAKWLAGGDMPTTPGAQGTLLFDHKHLATDAPPTKYADFTAPMPMVYEVLDCRPPYHVRFTWPDSADNRLSVVDIDLSEAGGGVLLRLTHRHLGATVDNLTGVLAGWDAHLGLLRDHLSGNAPRPFWTSLTANEARYGDHYREAITAMTRPT